MKKFSTLQCAPKSRSFTPLRAKVHNLTRWTSKYDIFRRYCKLRNFLPKIEREDFDDFVLSAHANRKIGQSMEKLEVIHSDTVAFQADEITLGEVREILSSVLSKFPEIKNCLAPDATIIHSPIFENDIAKVQGNGVFLLTGAEKNYFSAWREKIISALSTEAGHNNTTSCHSHRNF